MIDFAKINLKAGDGGNGAVAWRREKYEPTGGPAGGDGGDGGSIIIKATRNLSTLDDFKYKTKYKAENGQPGGKSKKFGKKGEDLILKVPVGTILREAESNTIIKDFKTDNEEFLIAKGGKGGRGNVHFKNSIRQAPRFAENGKKGQEIDLVMELKVLADVGLVGLPNVGKSTLISVITSAKPKIANYHFTTIDPNLGVVNIDKERSFIVADIPGLIEGANEGQGLGHDFLKHIERCRVLVHLVDISGIEGRDPIADFTLINEELKLYNEKLADKPMIIALNKTDLDFNDNASKFIEEFGSDYKIFKISAATTDGIKDLLDATYNLLLESENKKFDLIEDIDDNFLNDYYNREVEYDLQFAKENGIYLVYGKRIDNLLERVNLEDYDSRMYFESKLREMEVFDKLIEMGIEEGDSVAVGDIVFEYFE
ncbi:MULTISPECIES: GTPase ObgE [Anaerococcus]|uniref:GTPase ObgE n=1 Tax=Anaerococcus TaxID=165779 RepID=UPI0027B99828|nr:MULTISPECIES: GTPase ObgE [Anaerococcus]MDU3176319.1 GTPase ObgE [Anaerococcus sp.]MDU4025378.1 GTPase ObgE [Anaerococcus sp.]MDU5535141.1 GTPase ObgE [Anaerococcus sp.]